MAGRYAEIFSKSGDGQLECAAFLDRVGSDRCQPGNPVDGGVARSFFRPAPEAGAKPGRLCRSRARKKSAMLFPRLSGGTYGPAVDSGRRDPDEDLSVESVVSRDESRVGNVVVVLHKARIARFARSFTRFSDMELNEHAAQAPLIHPWICLISSCQNTNRTTMWSFPENTMRMVSEIPEGCSGNAGPASVASIFGRSSSSKNIRSQTTVSSAFSSGRPSSRFDRTMEKVPIVMFPKKENASGRSASIFRKMCHL